tara:strand:- start:405 stop:683 length:279 start_codon:yes stop_codon:yes gene_type:complete
MLKLLSIENSPLKTKKLRASFNDNTHIDFGAKGYSDYLQTNDDFRKNLYIKRHQSRENWNNPKSAGTLSRYISWNKKTLQASIVDYKKRFNL